MPLRHRFARSGRLVRLRRATPSALTACALAASFAGAVVAQTGPTPAASAPAAAPAASAAASAPLDLRRSPLLQPPPRGDAAKQLPIILRARELRGRPDLDTVAVGDAELRRGGMVIRADSLSYESADDLARARGNVRVAKDGNVYTGPELQLKVQRFEGFFLEPTYRFGRLNAGGRAARIDFADEDHAVASAATYTSCPADGSGDPAWLLATDKVSLDFAANEGIAENAVLRFYGVPILAAPRLSFPLTDERKSGWLPPTLTIDSKSGVQVAVPYYWNIAPNRDATITPTAVSRRGVGFGAEFRYLEPSFGGSVGLDLLAHDRQTGDARYAIAARHEQDLPRGAALRLDLRRVSDDDYWKDFPDRHDSLTPRLLGSEFALSQPFGDWTTYLNAQAWQVLQTADPTTRIAAPYQRLPQLGARYDGRVGGGFQVGFETEVNRFVNPDDWTGDPALASQLGSRPTGVRLHALGSISRPIGSHGWTLTPKISFNAASYALDRNSIGGSIGGSGTSTNTLDRQSTRVIPTVSVDSAWVFERDATWFGRSVRQTLEPRLLYVNTPFRDQSRLPNFDAAPKDFNFESYFSENTLTGVDRVSDTHQVTAGITTRFLDPATGAESLRLGLAQRYLLRDQRVTLKADGTPDAAFTQRFSDLLLLASTSLVPRWNLDASVQYNPEFSRTIRSIVGVRYSPGPFRTVSTTYRLTRDLSEQVELGWQWPLYGPTPDEARAGAGTAGRGGSCRGSWYTVGRLNYSTRDSRLTDAIAGFEYDAGCWIGRVVAERLSTGRSEATTRLLLQLELVGLSRLGSNPLQVLKDNIPGYRLLREERSSAAPVPPYDD